MILRTRLLDVLEKAPGLSGMSAQFVLVDDTAGYDEQTADLRSLPDVSTVTPPFNLGHQRALVYGLRVLAPKMQETDLVLTMDADGEDRPEDLPLLLDPLLDSPGDQRKLCVARRTKRRESLKFQVLYYAFRLLFRALTGVTIRNGNYAAYRGWLARRMLLHPHFDLCYSSTLVSLDLPVVHVPCPRGERYAGHSRMNLLRLFMHGIRMLMPFTDRIAIRALATFTAVFTLGVVLSAAVVAIKLFTSAGIPGWATAALLGMLTLSFLALGNFVVLFVVFSHSRGISLANLEESLDRRARGASSASA